MIDKKDCFYIDLTFCIVAFCFTTHTFLTLKSYDAASVGGTVLLLSFWLWPVLLGFLLLRGYLKR